MPDGKACLIGGLSCCIGIPCLFAIGLYVEQAIYGENWDPLDGSCDRIQFELWPQEVVAKGLLCDYASDAGKQDFPPLAKKDFPTRHVSVHALETDGSSVGSSTCAQDEVTTPTCCKAIERAGNLAVATYTEAAKKYDASLAKLKLLFEKGTPPCANWPRTDDPLTLAYIDVELARKNAAHIGTEWNENENTDYLAALKASCSEEEQEQKRYVCYGADIELSAMPVHPFGNKMSSITVAISALFVCFAVLLSSVLLRYRQLRAEVSNAATPLLLA